jgi:hypothetical protein
MVVEKLFYRKTPPSMKGHRNPVASHVNLIIEMVEWSISKLNPF